MNYWWSTLNLNVFDVFELFKWTWGPSDLQTDHGAHLKPKLYYYTGNAESPRDPHPERPFFNTECCNLTLMH